MLFKYRSCLFALQTLTRELHAARQALEKQVTILQPASPTYACFTPGLQTLQLGPPAAKPTGWGHVQLAHTSLSDHS